MKFADRLYDSIESHQSFICAGFDPVIEQFPDFLLTQTSKKTRTNEEFIEKALTEFFFCAIDSIKDYVACIKPNIAFYEQYGLPGLSAFISICSYAKENGLPVIADAKRGDIGSTAQAYASAFLGGTSLRGQQITTFAADAMTVNPFLGFDTLEVFLRAASEHEKGLFILVRTSNPGSNDLQSVQDSEGRNISERIADWIASKGDELTGLKGYSGLGAVIGATSPEIGRKLRLRMPKSLLLIPGYGAQGAGALDAVAAFDDKKHGAVINASRGLFGRFDATVNSNDTLKETIKKRVDAMNLEIKDALKRA